MYPLGGTSSQVPAAFANMPSARGPVPPPMTGGNGYSQPPHQSAGQNQSSFYMAPPPYTSGPSHAFGQAAGGQSGPGATPPSQPLQLRYYPGHGYWTGTRFLQGAPPQPAHQPNGPGSGTPTPPNTGSLTATPGADVGSHMDAQWWIQRTVRETISVLGNMSPNTRANVLANNVPPSPLALRPALLLPAPAPVAAGPATPATPSHHPGQQRIPGPAVPWPSHPPATPAWATAPRHASQPGAHDSATTVASSAFGSSSSSSAAAAAAVARRRRRQSQSVVVYGPSPTSRAPADARAAAMAATALAQMQRAAYGAASDADDEDDEDDDTDTVVGNNHESESEYRDTDREMSEEEPETDSDGDVDVGL